MYLGKGSTSNVSGIPIKIRIEDYLVPGSRLGNKDDTCYLPIFQSEPKNDQDSFDMWFLGNMFMDANYVVNEVDTTHPDKPLKIGIMPKKSGGSEGPDPDDDGSGAGAVLLAVFLTALVIALGAIGFCFYKKRKQNQYGGASSFPQVKAHNAKDDRQAMINAHDESNYTQD